MHTETVSDVLYDWMQVRAYDKSSQVEFLSAIPSAEKSRRIAETEANHQLQEDREDQSGNEGRLCSNLPSPHALKKRVDDLYEVINMYKAACM